METVLLIAVVGFFYTLCFIIGAVIGQKAARQETIEMNPIKAVNKAITEHKDSKEKQAEDEYIKTLMYNIDHYDGTGAMQKTLPRK